MNALVIGGSNGIGLAISKSLIELGYHVSILDKTEPDYREISSNNYTYQYCDLLDLNEDLISSYAQKTDISLLLITAGLGRVADFEYCHIAEIKNIMTVNTISTIQILRLFYNRIRNKETFYCGVMGSASGFISSPSTSIYAASKAAICRLIESVNIELEVFGTSNRILNVSPGSFKGSRFYGGKNQIDLLIGLSKEILTHLFSHDTLFIPQYEEIYKGVFDQYYHHPHEYGLYSYQYKKDSGRVDNNPRVIIGYLSGTFDLFRRAKKKCDYLIVGVHNSGKWKGKETFIPFEERKEIVAACKYVDKVVDACLEDSDAWDLLHYHKLFVGSDYKGTKRFNGYEEFFKDKNVEIIYFPYTQSTNSTQIRKNILLNSQDVSNK